MATISKQRAREFDKLKSQASDVWDDQKEALGKASHFWHDVGVEAASVAVKDVAPRVKSAYENQVKPAVASAASQGKDRLVNDVAPAVSDAVKSSSVGQAVKGSSLGDLVGSVDLDSLKKNGKKLSRKAKRKALKKAAKTAAKHPKGAIKVAKVAHTVKKSQKKGGHGGRTFLIILGIIGLGAVIFAAAQTLRADDELWVADDDDTAKN
ncbi:hypothetical protein AX769_04250 [Frondihabitans sp. PAMC 28766]|uniref:hypothetical protein n=1 Tax=Frondihabitans sp. PAMC 28766 TaxID=1795630 RepID=UPI00078C22A7|nr:hypothetical protein [Frondihabitans sp. PAMC 28766]AMM19497.1 hypothetical protein AX769_04250 [Frondihabitans sp. PAMC 28766]